MNTDFNELAPLNIELYKCISENIDTRRVILSDKQILHIAEKHPDSFLEVLQEVNRTIANPDYIIRDEKHDNTGLIIKKLSSNNEHTSIVLRICTSSNSGEYANSVISGWKISDKRLNSYLRNKQVLYKKN